jgi:heme/copper-type cytochrome/quinol oxidase subunit 2
MLVVVVVFGIIALALYIATFVMVGQNIDSTEDWNIIKSNLTKIWIITISASIALFLACSKYYKDAQGRDYFMYFILGIACLSLGLSYCAFMITMISK